MIFWLKIRLEKHDWIDEGDLSAVLLPLGWCGNIAIATTRPGYSNDTGWRSWDHMLCQLALMIFWSKIRLEKQSWLLCWCFFIASSRSCCVPPANILLKNVTHNCFPPFAAALERYAEYHDFWRPTPSLTSPVHRVSWETQALTPTVLHRCRSESISDTALQNLSRTWAASSTRNWRLKWLAVLTTAGQGCSFPVWRPDHVALEKTTAHPSSIRRIQWRVRGLLSARGTEHRLWKKWEPLLENAPRSGLCSWFY